MSPGLTAQPSAAPCAARQVNAFTVDVEDYFHVAALSSVISRDSWATREYRVEANTERLLALLAERSEEHTSELQSRVDIVCRLLLEKKKTEQDTVDLPAVSELQEGMTVVITAK